MQNSIRFFSPPKYQKILRNAMQHIELLRELVSISFIQLFQKISIYIPKKSLERMSLSYLLGNYLNYCTEHLHVTAHLITQNAHKIPMHSFQKLKM